MSNPVLQLDNVYRRYHQAERVIEVLSGASLSLYPGQLTALVGPSGAGKTTLLNMAGMLERPDEGEVYIQQVTTSGLPERQRTRLRGLHIGFVFQFHRLFPEFSALENIVIAQMINQLPRHEAEERAKELLAMVNLQDRAMHRPAQLSGGEQQRVAIARAVANAPEILLADEPTGNLDPETAAIVFQALHKLVHGTQTAALIVTHNEKLASQMDRVLRIEKGKLIAEG